MALEENIFLTNLTWRFQPSQLVNMENWSQFPAEVLFHVY